MRRRSSPPARSVPKRRRQPPKRRSNHNVAYIDPPTIRGSVWIPKPIHLTPQPETGRGQPLLRRVEAQRRRRNNRRFPLQLVMVREGVPSTILALTLPARNSWMLAPSRLTPDGERRSNSPEE